MAPWAATLFVLTMAAGSAFGGELYRMRVVAPPSVAVSDTFDMSIVIDHSAYPSSGSAAATTGNVNGFAFGLTIPGNCDVLGYQWGDAVDASRAAFSHSSVDGDLFNASMFGINIDPGLSDEVVRLTCKRKVGGAMCFEFQPPTDHTDDAATFVVQGAPLAAYTRDACVAVGPTSSEESGFPEPTEAELSAQWIVAEAGGGGIQMLGGEPEPTTDDLCGLDLELGFYEDLVDLVRGTDDHIKVHEASSIPTTLSTFDVADIQDAIDDAIASNAALSVIDVGPGIYEGQLVIDLDGMSSQSIYLVSTFGPEVTILDGDATDVTVRIEDSGGAPDDLFSFGYHEAQDFNIESPYPDGLARGWHGFTVTNGIASSYTDGAGIRVDTTVDQLDIRGNFIELNGLEGSTAPDFGGGIHVENFGGALQIVANVVQMNEADEGAGIAVALDSTGARAKISSNFVAENEADAQGGGIYAEDGVELCSNVIEGNIGSSGCGVYLRLRTDTNDMTYFLEDNWVRSNRPPDEVIAGVGGGLAMIADSTSTASAWSVGINRNRFYRNGKVDPDESSESDGIVTAGGGVYLSFRTDGAGPLDGDNIDEHFFTNNAIYDNHASDSGAGLYLGVNSDTETFAFDWNTIWKNKLHDTTNDDGAGFYVPSFFANNVRMRSCIISENPANAVTADVDWTVDGGSPMDDSDFDYCMSSDAYTAGYSTVDLWGTDSTLVNDPPSFTVGQSGNPVLMCHQDSDADSIDVGQDGVSLRPPHFSDDFDFEDRVQDGDDDSSAVTDMGADERPDETKEFQRGDANGDGDTDTSDPIKVLTELFVGGTKITSVCLDADDANDDGAIDISDAVFLLAYLYVIGAPDPPSPFGSCGDDPTPDALGCQEYSSCP